MKKYEQVAATIRARIEDGTYGPGALLPTQREIEATFEGSPSKDTAARAIKALISEGLVIAKPSVGNMVTDAISTGAARRRIDGYIHPSHTVSAEKPRRTDTPLVHAGDLGPKCIRRARTITRDGVPLQMSESHVSIDVADAVPEIDTVPKCEPSWQKIYEERTGRRVQVLTWHGARGAASAEAGFFGCQPGTALPVSWNRYADGDSVIGVSEVAYAPGTRLPVG